MSRSFSFLSIVTTTKTKKERKNRTFFGRFSWIASNSTQFFHKKCSFVNAKCLEIVSFINGHIKFYSFPSRCQWSRSWCLFTFELHVRWFCLLSIASTLGELEQTQDVTCWGCFEWFSVNRNDNMLVASSMTIPPCWNTIIPYSNHFSLRYSTQFIPFESEVTRSSSFITSIWVLLFLNAPQCWNTSVGQLNPL